MLWPNWHLAAHKCFCLLFAYYIGSPDVNLCKQFGTRSGPFASNGYPYKTIFDFTTAGDWDCVAAVERLPALHYSVDFIFLSFGIMIFIVEL